MQPRAPTYTTSKYDPKHEPARKNPLQMGLRDAYAAYDRMIVNEANQINLSEKDFPSLYTQEHFEALAAAIEELDRQKPLRGDNRDHRKKRKSRDHRKKRKSRDSAIMAARGGSRTQAIARAIYGGLPKDALRAVDTLIFG